MVQDVVLRGLCAGAAARARPGDRVRAGSASPFRSSISPPRWRSWRERPPDEAEFEGRSLVSALHGGDPGAATVVSEYLAEGVTAPAVMIRRGPYKYIRCPGDPDQLYELDSDPENWSTWRRIRTMPGMLGAAGRIGRALGPRGAAPKGAGEPIPPPAGRGRPCHRHAHPVGPSAVRRCVAPVRARPGGPASPSRRPARAGSAPGRRRRSAGVTPVASGPGAGSCGSCRVLYAPW